MPPDLINPPEAWEAAEMDINFWQEEEDRKEKLAWRQKNKF